MRFRVLGPLEARTGAGEVVVVGAGKQRTLLAVLLLHANRTVPADRLAAALWPRRAPRSAPGLLRTYVSGLRSALCLAQRPGLPRLVARHPGYRLDVEPADLDVLVFEELARRGRQAWAEGDAAGAATTFGEALRLWRGQVAEDVAVDDDASREVLVRLEERRLAVTEDWVDARLALGPDPDLLVLLQQLTEEHPLREHLWAQLMRALAGAGRRAEAVAAFGRLRGLMADELGLEPGAGLQELLRQILAGDDGTPAVSASPPPPARDEPVVPRQLPPPVRHFTGRTAECAALTGFAGDAARPGATVVISAVCGTAGVGKTALAVHWAHQVADRFPDGQLYVNRPWCRRAGRRTSSSA
ncbi:MAG: BTAD domain-containing putative transcriptional regulator [Mycobacteriales bacterium]